LGPRRRAGTPAPRDDAAASKSRRSARRRGDASRSRAWAQRTSRRTSRQHAAKAPWARRSRPPGGSLRGWRRARAGRPIQRRAASLPSEVPAESEHPVHREPRGLEDLRAIARPGFERAEHDVAPGLEAHVEVSPDIVNEVQRGPHHAEALERDWAVDPLRARRLETEVTNRELRAEEELEAGLVVIERPADIGPDR